MRQQNLVPIHRDVLFVLAVAAVLQLGLFDCVRGSKYVGRAAEGTPFCLCWVSYNGQYFSYKFCRKSDQRVSTAKVLKSAKFLPMCVRAIRIRPKAGA
jgi:hypothetical protein